jgi:dihydroxyacetone kinase-like protein
VTGTAAEAPVRPRAAAAPGAGLTADRLHRLILAVAAAVTAHEAELTALDQAIGDGDHGLNMRRGVLAMRAEAAGLARLPLPDALAGIGAQLVLHVGGASGPLYGTLLIALGRAAAPDGSNLAQALPAAVAAVMARGRSQPGQKTMLDVLAPVQQAVEAGGPRLARRLPAIARAAALATAPMRAARGRASFLGLRSVGHVDPGAWSAALIVSAACAAWEA